MNPTQQRRRLAVLSGAAIAVVVLAPGFILLAKNFRSGMATDIPVYDDPAIVELYTLRATDGAQYLGPYSRMRFHHPGPAMFHALAPFYELGDHNHGSLCIGAVVLTTVWMLAFVVSAMVVFGFRGSLWSGISLLILVLFASPYFLASIWNPNVGLLPLAVALVGCAGLGVRAWPMLPVLTIAASFAAQAHVLYAVYLFAMVATAGAAAVISRNWDSPSRARNARVFHLSLALSAVAGVSLWLPVFISPDAIAIENLRKLFEATLNQKGGWDLPAAVESCSYWLSAAYLGPFGVVARQGIQPAAMLLTSILGVLQLLVFVTFAAHGYQRKSAIRFAVGLLGTSSFMFSFVLTARPEADSIPHLVRWTFVSGPVYLGMIVSSLFRSHDTETPRAFRGAAALGWVLLLSTSIIAARDSLEWMGVQDYIRRGWGSTSYAPAWEILEPTMGAECRIGSHIRIMDDEFWPYAAGIFLQLEKNGRAASADPRWRFMFGRDGATDSRTPDCLTVLGRGVDVENCPGSNLVASLETKHGPLDIRLYSAAGNAVSGVLAVDHGDFDHLIEAGFCGFEPDERGGSRWSSGRRSVFNVFLRTGVAYRIEFEAQALNVPGMHQVASVSINNTPLGKLKISSSWDTYAVSIPRSAVRDLNRVAIEYAYAESPMALGRSNDRRTLAVRYRGFRFIAVEDRG